MEQALKEKAGAQDVNWADAIIYLMKKNCRCSARVWEREEKPKAVVQEKEIATEKGSNSFMVLRKRLFKSFKALTICILALAIINSKNFGLLLHHLM
jgi:hypothetical protein